MFKQIKVCSCTASSICVMADIFSRFTKKEKKSLPDEKEKSFSMTAQESAFIELNADLEQVRLNSTFDPTG